MTPKKKAQLIAQTLLDKKAQDVVIMNLHKVTDMTHYFVVCTGESELHLKALARELEAKIKTPWHIEGTTHARWILLDYVDVVVHIFLNTTRQYYMLEQLWGDVPIEKLSQE
ncbi:MAG: ribosome silencing factor [Candidatus Stahlbacteria bacterium]|nr:ribosome silencing factor [Candidatus Stahlbacteria bacterium]